MWCSVCGSKRPLEAELADGVWCSVCGSKRPLEAELADGVWCVWCAVCGSKRPLEADNGHTWTGGTGQKPLSLATNMEFTLQWLLQLVNLSVFIETTPNPGSCS